MNYPPLSAFNYGWDTLIDGGVAESGLAFHTVPKLPAELDPMREQFI